MKPRYSRISGELMGPIPVHVITTRTALVEVEIFNADSSEAVG